MTAAILCFAPPAGAVVFSLTGTSAMNFGLSGADLLTVGMGGMPVVAISASNLGLIPGMGPAPGDELNAVSFGPFVGTDAYFSVDGGSTGQSSTVIDIQATAGHQAADIFVDPFPIDLLGLPSLAFDQSALGLGTSDDIDALDMDPVSVMDTDGNGVPDIPVFFSLAPGSPTLTLLGATAADILVTAGGAPPSVAVSAATLGLNLLQPGDDIDALLYDPTPSTGSLVLSLAPGSPTLAGNGWSAADIFAPLTAPQPGFAGPTAISGQISTLGLVVNDNVDAFSDMPSVTTGVPEPATLFVLGIGLLGLGITRRRRFG